MKFTPFFVIILYRYIKKILAKSVIFLLESCVYRWKAVETVGDTMEDVKIVQLYFERDEQAIPETANKYGNY